MTPWLDRNAWPALRQNPNQVFTRDSIVTLPWVPEGYIPCRMREPLRRGETAVLESALQGLGLRSLLRLPADVFLEGGDVVPFTRAGRRTLLVGFGPRSSCREALYALHRALVPEHIDEIFGFELAPHRMNLDGGLLPVSDSVALIEPTSFQSAFLLDDRERRAPGPVALLRELGYRLIEVTREASVSRQACNAVCLGGGRIIYYDLAPDVAEELREHGIEPDLVPGTELVKGHGGPRCMTRPPLPHLIRRLMVAR